MQKSSIVYVWLGSKYASGTYDYIATIHFD